MALVGMAHRRLLAVEHDASVVEDERRMAAAEYLDTLLLDGWMARRTVRDRRHGTVGVTEGEHEIAGEETLGRSGGECLDCTSRRPDDGGAGVHEMAYLT